MTNIVTVLIHGPLGGATKRRPDVVHAITTETATVLATGSRRVLTAPCGAKNIRFLTSPDGRVVLWPIRAEGPWTRCRQCWIATGKKRPRSTLSTTEGRVP